MRRQPQTAPPAYWELLLTKLLKAEPKLAYELWQVFLQRWPWRVTTTAYALNQLMVGVPTVEVWQQRAEHFERILPASDLLTLTLTLSPEGTKRRRPDVVQLEEAILHYMTNEGTWR